MATVLEIREKSRKVKKGKNSQEKSGNFDKLSEPERSATPQVQLDDLSFCQNAISKSQGKRRSKKWPPCSIAEGKFRTRD